jgi:hypothetical protein
MVKTDCICNLGWTSPREKLVKILHSSVAFRDTYSLTSDLKMGDHYVCLENRQTSKLQWNDKSLGFHSNDLMEMHIRAVLSAKLLAQLK